MHLVRLSTLLMLAAVIMAACQAPVPPASAPPGDPAGPAATATPPIAAATSTSRPDATATDAAPTATPTAAPTDTAAPPATPDPNEGVGDIIYSDPLNGGAWYWTFEDDAARFGVSNETKQLETLAKQANTWRFTSSNDTINIGNQQIRVNARTNVCADADQYALLFRGTVDAAYTQYNFYAFKLRCGGQARLELLQGADARVIVDWTASPAIRTGAGVDNALLIWAYQDQMRFYVNGEYLFSAQDSTLGEGFYGFYLQDRTNGNMSVSWTGLEARSISLP